MSQSNYLFLVVNCTQYTIYNGNVTHTAGKNTSTSANIPVDGLTLLQTTSITPFFPESGKKDKWAWSYRILDPNTGPIITGSLDCEINYAEDYMVVVVLTGPGATVVRMMSKGACTS